LKIRNPAQAGMFYSGSARPLVKEIEDCFKHKLGPARLPERRQEPLAHLVALVCPHAGYIYSGPVAATAYLELARYGKPSTVVIIGPNHTGMGSGVSLMNEGTWTTPLGRIDIDSTLANAILENAPIIDIDEKAHAYEHSIEVQLPFLQYLYEDDFSLVPICMMIQDLETGREIGEAIAKATNDSSCLVVASSDMTHYEPHNIASEKDMSAVRAIERMNDKELDKVVQSNSISICGVGPIISAMTFSKKRGATKGHLLSYRTSGEVCGDYSSVVGYAAIAFVA